MVFSWLTEDEPTDLGTTYTQVVGNSAIVLPFQTVAELRFGALNRSWGELRLRRMERTRTGHPLWEKIHDSDRWIAASAVRLNVPVVSHDAIFRGVPGLELISANGS
jgi:predicted nucleic acid-binding protein